MGYIEDAKELINDAKSTFEEIKSIYNNSLNDQHVRPKLLIKIKNFMENLRSALDFTANSLFDKYGSTSYSKPKIYFPYAKYGLSQKDFQTKNIIEKCIPGLKSHRPDIASKIESFQWFSNSENNWLPKFMELNNENKHQRLSPQTRNEIKELRIKTENIEMRITGNMKISGDTTIKLGNSTIRGIQNISPDNPAIIEGNASQEIITWVSFVFSDNNEPVLSLLESALNGTKKIVSEFEKI